jgi:threonyl-tRNA synthetase
MANKKEILIKNENKTVSVNESATIAEIAEDNNCDSALGAVVDGKLSDLRDVPDEGSEVRFVSYEDEEGKEIYWHTSSHMLAHAVKRYVDDEVKLAIGPAIENGFYYDFDLPDTLSEDDLYHLEGIIKGIINQDLPIKRRTLEKDEAKKMLEEEDEPYKLELLEELEGKPSFYSQGEFEDLCAGPHLLSTGQVGAVKLTKLAGSYWRGDEENETLQRIYGVSFKTEEELEEYEHKLQEAKKRDHRKLGRELDLFHIEDKVGPGLVIWHPRGSRIRTKIEDYWRGRHLDSGYELVYTPHLAREELWEISGHLSHYEENMFPALEMEDENYRVKPMNCPFHMQIFNSQTRSYRDLPMRLAELGTVYRYEKSGVLHGLLRVRGFTQDDAHIFCRPDQLEEELVGLLDFTTEILSTFGFIEYEIFLSTQPDKFVGSQDRWDLATDSLRNALDESGLPYEIDPGEGVYYGPKIDLKIKDSLDREWQCSTIQVDFNIPERFDVEYTDDDGESKRPIMIHRALFGSLERFFGCLVEHYGGAFPPWLAWMPVQILPISDSNNEYAEEVQTQFKKAGIRSEIQYPDESLGKRIHTGISDKIPFLLIVGADEEKGDTVEFRPYGSDESFSLSIIDAVKKVKKAIETRAFIHEE